MHPKKWHPCCGTFLPVPGLEGPEDQGKSWRGSPVLPDLSHLPFLVRWEVTVTAEGRRWRRKGYGNARRPRSGEGPAAAPRQPRYRGSQRLHGTARCLCIYRDITHGHARVGDRVSLAIGDTSLSRGGSDNEQQTHSSGVCSATATSRRVEDPPAVPAGSGDTRNCALRA